MVTRSGDNELENALSKAKESDKWDLEDLSQRDAWLLTTKSKLKKDPDVWAAVTVGPPTVDMVLKQTPSITRGRACYRLVSITAGEATEPQSYVTVCNTAWT